MVIRVQSRSKTLYGQYLTMICLDRKIIQYNYNSGLLDYYKLQQQRIIRRRHVNNCHRKSLISRILNTPRVYNQSMKSLETI